MRSPTGSLGGLDFKWAVTCQHNSGLVPTSSFIVAESDLAVRMGLSVFSGFPSKMKQFDGKHGYNP